MQYPTYTPYGEPLVQMFGGSGGVSDFHEYDPATRRVTKHFAEWTTPTGNERHETGFTYDPAGNITAMIDRAPGDWTGTGPDSWRQCYAYDNLQRLTAAWTSPTVPCGNPSTTNLGNVTPYAEVYYYSPNGNRTHTTKVRGIGSATVSQISSSFPAGTAPRPHAITAATTQSGAGTITESFVHDPAGNLESRSTSPTAGLDYIWDAENLLTSVTDRATSDTATYIYDAKGNRLIGDDESTGIRTLYLGSTEIRVSSTATTSTRHYTIGENTPVATRTSTGLEFLVADHQGTPTITVDADDHTFIKRRLDPFGNPLDDPTPAWPTNRGFLNKTADNLMGTNHLDAREYDPVLGRFISVDPVLDPMDPQQMNGYAYANNNPVTMMDPTGLLIGMTWNDWVINALAVNDNIRVANGLPTLAQAAAVYQDPAAYNQGTAQIAQAATKLKTAAVVIATDTAKDFTGCIGGSWGSCAWAASNFVGAGSGALVKQAGKQIIKRAAKQETKAAAKGLVKQGKKGAAAGSDGSELPGLLPNAPKPLGRGSTGRTTPASIEEQMAMTSVRNMPGGKILENIEMRDPLWPHTDGWVKMSQNEAGVEIHYVRNQKTGDVDDFKFVR